MMLYTSRASNIHVFLNCLVRFSLCPASHGSMTGTFQGSNIKTSTWRYMSTLYTPYNFKPNGKEMYMPFYDK